MTSIFEMTEKEITTLSFVCLINKVAIWSQCHTFSKEEQGPMMP